MQLPSLKTIENGLKIDRRKARKIRDIMERFNDRYRYSAPDFPSYWLDLISAELDSHGAEYIPAGTNKQSPSIAYVNAGDPYTTTVLFVNSRFKIGNWGAIVERGNYA